MKSRQVSKDWTRSCQLFERTLKSICNQTSNNFLAFVICHEIPEIEFSPPNVRYIQVNFPPPAKDNCTSKEWYFRCEVDKNRKVLMGICEAKAYLNKASSSYVMVVDADDCVSNKIVEFLENNPVCNGFFLAQGYIYSQLTGKLTFKYRKFNLMCGTSNIVNIDLISTPSEPEYDRGYGYYRDNVIFLKHDQITDVLKKQGNPLKPLPFPGAIYITDNSENIYYRYDRGIYGKKIEEVLGFRFVTPEFRKEFCLYKLE